jgi:tetraacyldisaccharide 4'-kinase
MFQNFKRPQFWETRGPLAWLLWPLSRLYARGVQLWINQQTTLPLPIPSLCIGNATVGGEGKTPLVMAIAEEAKTQKIQVHVVIKPHQVTLKLPLRVDPTLHTAHQVGDEALMVARRGIITWVGPKRHETALVCAKAGAELVIFDDGFQDPTIASAHKFLLLGTSGGNGFVLPAGPGREDLKAAAARADGYIVDESLTCPPSLPQRPIFTVKRQLQIPDGIRHKALMAFCAIGNPQQFKRDLLDAGLNLVDDVIFPDHYTYASEDLSRLSRLAAQNNALLITTEKDEVKIPLTFGLQVQVIPLKITLNDVQGLLKTVFSG